MIESRASHGLRAITTALGVGLFGVALTVTVIVHEDFMDAMAYLIFLVVRLTPYVELIFLATLLDRIANRSRTLSVVLASTVLIAVDSYVTFIVFWGPSSTSTGGIAGVLAMLALVFVLIPGAILVGLALTPSNTRSTPAHDGGA